MGVNIKVRYKPERPIPENYEYHDGNAAESFENNGVRWSLADGTMVWLYGSLVRLIRTAQRKKGTGAAKKKPRSKSSTRKKSKT
jgi:hypothetical protein